MRKIADLSSITEFNLSYEEVLKITTLFIAVWILISLYAVRVYKDDKKRMAWVVSLVNSAVTMICGLLYLVRTIIVYPNLLFLDLNYPRDIFQSVDNFSFIVCVWFAIANIFDLIVGLVFYPKYLDPLTAYVHHTIFIWIMYSSTSANVVPLFHLGKVEVYASSFVLMLIEELPTFFLSLGRVFPRLRTDAGFGSTFLLLRIIYHAYMLVYSYLLGATQLVTALYSLTLILHVFWFKNWATKYFFHAKTK